MSTKSRIASKMDALLASKAAEEQSTTTPAAIPESRPGKTGPGQMLMFNGMIKEADEKVKRLEGRLAEFEGSDLAKKRLFGFHCVCPVLERHAKDEI
jgi:hypothetical protein